MYMKQIGSIDPAGILLNPRLWFAWRNIIKRTEAIQDEYMKSCIMESGILLTSMLLDFVTLHYSHTVGYCILAW